MKAFVTGANGFIGSHLVAQLTARGDNVTCLVREPGKAAALEKMGAQLVQGDVTDRARVRETMRGADVVFHLAGIYRYGAKYLPHMRAVNVDGARNVLETAAELGASRIIHTSSVAVFGNTRGLMVDESYQCKKEDVASEYERTKWEAQYEVAAPLQKRGAPVIVVLPGVVTGPNDPSPHMMQVAFYLNRFPVGFGAKSGVTWAHVDDIAAGHILATERGKNGEAYVLAGPALTWKQAQEMWQELTGIPAPKIWLPGWMVALNHRALALVERTGLHLPLSADAVASQADYTFWASADKAKRELGWKPRPVEETFREMLEFEMRKRGRMQ